MWEWLDGNGFYIAIICWIIILVRPVRRRGGIVTGADLYRATKIAQSEKVDV